MLRTAIVLLLMSAMPAFAQSPNTATLIVTVVDQSGANVPGAQVSAMNLAAGGSREAVSDADGSVTLTALSISGVIQGHCLEDRIHRRGRCRDRAARRRRRHYPREARRQRR